MLIVTAPEPTPVSEAEQLQNDLLRAGIHPWAWIVNNSIAAAQPQSPLTQRRARNNSTSSTASEGLAPRLAAIPLLPEEPVGEAALARLTTDAALV